MARTYLDPVTPEEWQTAADCAHGALVLDAARQYGLVTGGPVVNVERCEDVLKRAAKRGITPRPDAVERLLDACQAGARSPANAK